MLLLFLLLFHYVLEQASSTGLGACFFFFFGSGGLDTRSGWRGFVVEVGVAGRELGRSVATFFHVFFFLGDFNQCLLIAFFISEH